VEPNLIDRKKTLETKNECEQNCLNYYEVILILELYV